VFFHLHGSDSLFSGDVDEDKLLRRVTEAEPGKLVDKRIEIFGPGNEVLSYLDVIAPDGTPWDEIDRALQEFRTDVTVANLPVHRRLGDILVAFGALFGLRGAQQQEEYDRLRAILQIPLRKAQPEKAG
jgi:hypothetical protein